MWRWLGRCRGLEILAEKSVDERSSGLEARDERMLSVDDFLLGGPREGLRLSESSSAMLLTLLTCAPGGR